MVVELNALEEMVYPGRVVIVGRTKDGHNIAGYALSGRSPSSKARRLEITKPKDSERSAEAGRMVYIGVTDPSQLEKGDPALLVYTAMAMDRSTIIVSNGAQTELLRATARTYRLMTGEEAPLGTIFDLAFAEGYEVPKKDGTTVDLASYEPDSPILTPRVSGLVRGNQAALSVLKRGTEEGLEKCTYAFKLQPGHGKMIATYHGPNPEKPGIVPAFIGEPRDITFNVGFNPRTTGQEIADVIYNAMGEFTVASACMTENPSDIMGKQFIYVATQNLHKESTQGGK